MRSIAQNNILRDVSGFTCQVTYAEVTGIQFVRVHVCVNTCMSRPVQDLFFEYTWNNFLHTQVECCVNTALASALVLNGDSEQVEQHEEGQQDNPSSLRHHVSNLECRLLKPHPRPTFSVLQ